MLFAAQPRHQSSQQLLPASGGPENLNLHAPCTLDLVCLPGALKFSFQATSPADPQVAHAGDPSLCPYFRVPGPGRLGA